MDTNVNQRKRTGRLNKTNDTSMGPPPPVGGEGNEILEVAALAISPTSGEAESLNSSTPAAECRRSSRKKIIKFDVRDLLNKNRKPHKIQIEARIDSNAPTTSKTTAIVGETIGTSSFSGSGDLSSKQKTFLEKSAIFRRYSISQEPKPPPPPLPLPPSLLGKGNDKDLSGADTTTTRRLSRTQEFFSNVMIKPKQTTSLIVAQMESSAPSQIGKRKTFNKSIEIETKLSDNIDSSLANATQQKKRGRRSKIKIQTTEDSAKEEVNIKKITPEKAKNWKEYKACLAQQLSAKEKSNLSTHNSKIEDSKDKEELDINSLDQEQPHKKTQKDSSTKYNLKGEIVVDDSNLKDDVILTIQNKEILQKNSKKDLTIQKTDFDITKGPIKGSELVSKVSEITSIQQATNKNKLEVSLEKESDDKVLSYNKDDIEKRDKDLKEPPKNEEEKESNIPQTTLKETTRNRRQIKLSENVQKQTVSKGKKSPTNLDTSSQPDKYLKTFPSYKNESIDKKYQSKQEESDKDNNSTDDQTKEKGIIKIMMDECVPKKADSKESTNSLTALDISKQEQDSKEAQKFIVVAEQIEQTKEDNTTKQDNIKNKQTKLDENFKKSAKVMAVTRSSRIKLDDSITKATDSKACRTIKEQKDDNGNQSKLKDSFQQDTDPKTSSIEEVDTLQQGININKGQSMGDIFQKDSSNVSTISRNSQSNKEQELDSKISKSKEKSDDCLQNVDLTKTTQINKEQKAVKIGETKIEASLQTDTPSEVLQDPVTLQSTTEESVITTTGNKKQITKKEENVQKECESLHTYTVTKDSQLNKNEIDPTISQSAKDEKLVTTTRVTTRKLNKKETNENLAETNKELKVGRKEQSKLEDFLQKGAESQAFQKDIDCKTSQSTMEEEGFKNKNEIESKDGGLQTDTDSEASQSTKEETRSRRTPSKLDDFVKQKNLPQAQKKLKTRKRGQTIQHTDSSQKDIDSESSNSQNKEIDSKIIQSTTEDVGNKRKLTKKKAITEKDSENYHLQKKAGSKVFQYTKGDSRSRSQSKLNNSSPNDTDSEDPQSKEKAGNKRKFGKKELNAQKVSKDDKIRKDIDSEVAQSPKEDTITGKNRSKHEDPVQNQTISIISRTTKKEETTTTPSNKEKFTKETPAQKEDFTFQRSDDNKILDQNSDKEENLTYADVKDSNKKRISRNKRKIIKLDESIQKEKDIQVSFTNKETEIKSILTQCTEETNKDNANNLSSSQKTELKFPENTATCNTQIEQENIPTLKESSLFEPSSPSEEKSVTFSRTSSSSESENFSERSSFSSTTSSTSTSGRSYHSGDKLLVSIKRIPLPKSPSTSSQTSTSEEQNTPDFSLNIMKKKPPTAKRSKRLQNRSLELLNDQDSMKNIDDCFQKISTDEKERSENKNKDFNTIESLQENQNFDEKKEAPREKLSTEVSPLKSIEKKKCTKTSLAQSPQTRNKKANIIQESKEQIEVDEAISSELRKKQFKEGIQEESTKMSSELQDEKNMKDLVKPTTSKSKNTKDVSTMAKRKSLRIRKDDSEEKDQENKEQEVTEEIKEKYIQLLQEKNTKQEKEKIPESNESEVENTETKSNLKDQEETLSETKKQENRNFKDKPEQQNDHEKKEDSKKEKLEEQITYTKQQKKKNTIEHEDTITEHEMQEKINIKEQERKIAEKQVMSQEKKHVGLATNKPIGGKKSPKSFKATSFSCENTEIEEKESPKSNIKKDELSTEPSPRRKRSGKETTSAANLAYKDPTNKSITDEIENVTSNRSKAGNTSPVEAEGKSPKNLNKLNIDIKENETSKFTSTRSKPGKTSPVQATKSPKTSTKSSEEFTTNLVDDTEKESLKSCSTAKISDINPTSKSSTDLKEIEPTKFTRNRNGKTSSVEDSTKNSDVTEKESLKSYSTNLKQKITSADAPKTSPEDNIQPDVDSIEEESLKGSSKIIRKDMLSEKAVEKTLISDITQNESLKTPTKIAKATADNNVTIKECSVIKSSEELSSIATQETSSLPPKNIIKHLIDINEQESSKPFSKKSKAQKDSSPLSSTTIEDAAKYASEVTELQSPRPTSSTKTTPSSTKRKSLRNQKDKNSDDSTSSSVETNEQDKLYETTIETAKESVSSLNLTQEDLEKEKLDTISKAITEEAIKIPKKRGRKSRFKNLHGPETESETESSTGKQTPIDESMMADRKNDLTPPPNVETPKNDEKVVTNNTTVKGIELDENNEKESLPIMEDLNVVKPTTSASGKKIKKNVEEKGDEITMDLKEKSQPEQEQNTTKHLLASEKPLLNPSLHSETYLIKNVSIETNTLLDILRTVQSNTAAAALEANRKSENPTEDKPVTTKSLTDTQISITKSEDLPSTSQDKNLLTLKSLHTLEEDSNTNFPTHSDTASPLTLKKVAISPTRSDSSSPLTLKKLGQSPSRSETSSPLTLKKVTRRYERRSRRGDDSAHKTLEETFAEIAAQSCKAVLAAKGFDINDEFIANPLEEDKFEMDTTREQTTEGEKADTLLEKVENVEKPLEKVNDIDDSSTEILKKSQDTEQSALEVSNKSECEYTTEIYQDKSSEHTALKTPEFNIPEKELEIPESCKVTPVRRGRKPKNRVIETLSPVNKDTINQKDIKKSKDTLEAKDPEELTSSKDSLPDSPIKTTDETTENQEPSKETANNKDESNSTKDLPKISEIAIVEENKQPDYCTESSILTDIQETSEDNTKPSKKLNKKRDTTKESPSTADDGNTYQEDDIRTPKQTTKKRDSSLTKGDSKSIGKKSSKKTKNNEEESIDPQKIDNTPKSTTPPKRGRKPKNQQDPQQPTTSSKKKTRKETVNESNDDENLGEKRKELESESESLNSSLDKSLDEKIAKKKRQKKLKEAFEAALTEDLNKNKDTINSNSSSTSCFGLTLLNKSPPPEKRNSILPESTSISCITPVEPEEDPDPLKDIEKFIADGVNLLKKDYKIDEDSVDDVITTKTTDIEKTPIKTIIDDKPILNTFETPADTPIMTPSVTPPPKSPTSAESTTPDENSGVRRSHRIKLITQTPKALVGRGLVRDKERLSIKDDIETKSHYTLDDHLMDLAEVEAKNAKFLKEMEERLSNFQVIKENDYLCERVISREARKMICDCFLTHEEEERGELGCGEDCLNRLLMIECGPECNVKDRCTNKRFQKLLCSPCRVFRTEKKGFGIMADIEILPGEFIMEYVGEVIDTEIFEQRRIMYSQDKNRHYYFMALRSDAIIDATIKGNISRFINHSCDPNAETQKWTVNGELRIGFFSRKSIMPGEEITFNYQYQRYGREAQRCYCESSNCRGWIGPEPTSDEGEQIDDEYESEDDDEFEEEETQVTASLLEQDDDEDSDASVVDPEEVQKKLEMAAAQAEVDLAPITIMEETAKEESITTENKENDSLIKPVTEEEDSKSKFKKLLSIMAEKVAAKQKQNKREQKQRKKKSKESSSELTNKLRFLEDPDIEDEVEFLRECGLKNQSDTLRLSRLMVRAKLVQTRLNLLDILRKGDLPCRRLFLDYHGLRLVHGWMSEDAGNMQIRLSLLQTLETLPIANKTVLTDTKVMQMVRNWCGSQTALSPNDDSSSSNSNSQDISLSANANLEEGSELQELQKLALKLITTWEGLPEIFRIPKKERIEQMKEHEREADRQYAANAEKEENKTFTDRYRRDRFGKGLNSTAWAATPSTSNRFLKPNNGNPLRTSNTTTATTPKSNKNLSKAQRREMFAAKVARDEAEKRMAEERREFETKCRFFGLDPKKTRPQDVPFCVNPATGQWYSIERKPIITPPSYAHVQVPLKPKSTDPSDYRLPSVCNNLPPQWKYAITPQGKIYYYHIKFRIPQWEPPTLAQLQQCEMEAEEDADSEGELATTAGEDSSEDDDEILIGMDAIQLRAYIDRKVETRRQKRYQRLVDQRPISPRREEDRIYNQIEVRKYKENKEKIRKRKEEIRRKRAEALRQSSLNMCTLGSINETNLIATKIQTESDEELGVLPIQDYLLSSDEEIDLKAEVNSPLIDKIVEGDKIVDELDALTSKRQLKRPLPPHRDLSEPSTSSSASTSVITTTIDRQEYKKRKLEKKEKRKPKDQDAKYRKNKEKFRCEIAGIIVHHLKPYRRDTCTIGRIQSNDDFNHLARKLTHFVMIKELKYCDSVGQTLVVTESVKNKSREFIKKYMAKYNDVYIKPPNDPDFKDIPFTL